MEFSYWLKSFFRERDKCQTLCSKSTDKKSNLFSTVKWSTDKAKMCIRDRLIPFFKWKIYRTVIRPVLCYGCEAWTITQKTVDIVDTFERKILRRIIGPIQENSSWRLRYNNELYQIYKEIPVSKFIRIQRLRWAGHVMRMEDGRNPKRALLGTWE